MSGSYIRIITSFDEKRGVYQEHHEEMVEYAPGFYVNREAGEYLGLIKKSWKPEENPVQQETEQVT